MSNTLSMALWKQSFALAFVIALLTGCGSQTTLNAEQWSSIRTVDEQTFEADLDACLAANQGLEQCFNVWHKRDRALSSLADDLADDLSPGGCKDELDRLSDYKSEELEVRRALDLNLGIVPWMEDFEFGSEDWDALEDECID